MIIIETEKKRGIESTKDTMKQKEEIKYIIPLIVIKKIGIGTIQRMKEMNIKEKKSDFLMKEVIVFLHLNKMIMTKDLHFPETNLPNSKKEKLTR